MNVHEILTGHNRDVNLVYIVAKEKERQGISTRHALLDILTEQAKAWLQDEKKFAEENSDSWNATQRVEYRRVFTDINRAMLLFAGSNLVIEDALDTGFVDMTRFYPPCFRYVWLRFYDADPEKVGKRLLTQGGINDLYERTIDDPTYCSLFEEASFHLVPSEIRDEIKWTRDGASCSPLDTIRKNILDPYKTCLDFLLKKVGR